MTVPYRDALRSATPESIALLHELGDVLEVGILVLDRDLVVRGWNRWLSMASGTSTSDVVGRSLLDAFPELRGGAAERAMTRALAGGTTVWAQQFHGWLLPMPAPSGYEQFERMQQSARIMPLLKDGEVDGVLALVHDVTERVAREQELRGALQDAEAASQAKSDFLASMSHELRTPLAAIVGYMDLLDGEMVGPVSPIQKTYLGRVRTAARHLISIIEEILTFSRVEAGKEDVFSEPCDAASLLGEVIHLFEPLALQKQLALTLSLGEGPVTMSTDVTKLRQILINLLGNAVKFTDTGSVDVSVQKSGGAVTFRIRDTGPGIVASDLNRIFDPFTQVDQRLTRAKGGTGLGLPVSRRLATLLGGELMVESTVGSGTTFTLTLPAQPPVLVFDASAHELERASPRA